MRLSHRRSPFGLGPGTLSDNGNRHYQALEGRAWLSRPATTDYAQIGPRVK